VTKSIEIRDSQSPAYGLDTSPLPWNWYFWPISLTLPVWTETSLRHRCWPSPAYHCQPSLSISTRPLLSNGESFPRGPIEQPTIRYHSIVFERGFDGSTIFQYQPPTNNDLAYCQEVQMKDGLQESHDSSRCW